jgi:hypothetical protein
MKFPPTIEDFSKCNYVIHRFEDKASSKICGAKAIKFYIWTDPWAISFISRCENHVNYKMASLSQSQEVTYEEALIWEVLGS